MSCALMVLSFKSQHSVELQEQVEVKYEKIFFVPVEKLFPPMNSLIGPREIDDLLMKIGKGRN